MIKKLKQAFIEKTIFEKNLDATIFVDYRGKSLIYNLIRTIWRSFVIAIEAMIKVIFSIMFFIPFILINFAFCITTFFEITILEKIINVQKKKKLLKILEKYALECETIYPNNLCLTLRGLEDDTRFLPTTFYKDVPLKIFIKNFVRGYNYKYDTSNGNAITCFRGKRRSLGDIYLICRHYYPNCKIEEVLTILINLLQEQKIYGSYCSTINKYVFHLSSTFTNTNCEVEYTEDYEFSEFVKIFGKDE